MRLARPKVPESSLLVVAPEAHQAVRWTRWRFDRSSRLGMPPHVTVLYPFADPARLDSSTLSALRELFAIARPFAFELTEVRWFGDRVVYLAPDPAEPFEELTRRVVERFPRFQPYGGAYDRLVPHLSLGTAGNARSMRRSAGHVSARLPIRSMAREVVLMAHGQPWKPWRALQSFALGGGDVAAPV